jgi:hypothetical protein
MKKLSCIVLAIILLVASTGYAGALFSGYEKLPWGSSVKNVSKAFPKGKMGKLGSQTTYKQTKPSADIKQRTFAFSANGLVAVSVTLSPEYVKKNGIEKVLARYKKQYGEGVIDRTGAPHMVTYRWQGKDIRITFAYAPKRPEMSVLMYEKK